MKKVKNIKQKALTSIFALSISAGMLAPSFGQALPASAEMAASGTGQFNHLYQTNYFIFSTGTPNKNHQNNVRGTERPHANSGFL